MRNPNEPETQIGDLRPERERLRMRSLVRQLQRRGKQLFRASVDALSALADVMEHGVQMATTWLRRRFANSR